jgi:HlyD family secretion protein
MKTNKLLIILLIAAAVLIIFVIIGKKKGWIGKQPEVKVAVEKPKKNNIIESIVANGKIKPEMEVKITPDVSGEIVELHVKEGDFVKKGQMLIKIKPENYISAQNRAIATLNSAKARLEQAKAQFTKSEQDYRRSKKLWEEKTISDAEYEQALSAYNVAMAEVKAAEYNVGSAEAALEDANESLRKTSIFAPISGTVSQLNVELGERVAGTSLMAGTDMLHIADLTRMEVIVNVNENDIVKVSINDTALIEVDAYLDRKFKGIVTQIANSANTTGLTSDQVTNFEVKIFMLPESYSDLINEYNKHPFRPGMSATAEIQTETKYNVLSVPIQAVTTRPDSLLTLNDSIKNSKDKGNIRTVVFIAEQGKAKIIPVKTGIQDNSFIEIIEGVDTSMQVIVAPYSAISKKLKDGETIKIVDIKELFNKQ